VAATEKLLEPNHVRTRGTDNSLPPTVSFTSLSSFRQTILMLIFLVLYLVISYIMFVGEYQCYCWM